MISLRAPSQRDLDAFLERQRDVPLSYSEVGATRSEPFPPGYQVDRRRAELGTGDTVFARARQALIRWNMHTGAGVRVAASGDTVALVVRAAGLYTTSACRVVYRIDDPARFAFAYGTLADHPVSGEERFVIERQPSGQVTFELAAFSRPRTILLKLAAPIARRTQLALGAAYVAALTRCATLPA
jgi:uncharacterized protein (UPF0548 family)